jgi:hypothetical protein
MANASLITYGFLRQSKPGYIELVQLFVFTTPLLVLLVLINNELIKSSFFQVLRLIKNVLPIRAVPVLAADRLEGFSKG